MGTKELFGAHKKHLKEAELMGTKELFGAHKKHLKKQKPCTNVVINPPYNFPYAYGDTMTDISAIGPKRAGKPVKESSSSLTCSNPLRPCGGEHLGFANQQSPYNA